MLKFISFFIYFLRWDLKRFNKKNSYYDFCKLVNELNRNLTIKKSINNQPNLIFKFLKINKNIFEIALRQKILKFYSPPYGSLFYYLSISKHIPLLLPLPSGWFRLIEKNQIGLKFNFFVSFVTNFLISLVIHISVLKILFLFLFCRKNKNSNYSYIFDPEINSINNTTYKTEKLTNWILKNFNDSGDLAHPYQNVAEYFFDSKKIKPISKNMYLMFDLNFFSKIKILYYFIILNIFSFLYLLLGKWHFSFMLPDLFLNIITKHAKKNNLANYYFFSYGSFIYRPLWTYQAEKLGSKIICYNYSVNFRFHLYKNEYPPQEIGFEALSWPKVLTWSDQYINYHKKFFRINPFVKTSYIMNTDTEESLFFPKKYILIFDIAPVRKLFSQLIFPLPDYLNGRNAVKFLMDILDICEENKLNVLWKPKRQHRSFVDKSYHFFTNEIIQKYKCLTIINPLHSPYKLCQKATAVISTPFTSTAYIGKLCNTPSIYYDSSGILSKKDNGSHGMPLIKDKESLKNWLITHYRN